MADDTINTLSPRAVRATREARDRLLEHSGLVKELTTLLSSVESVSDLDPSTIDKARFDQELTSLSRKIWSVYSTLDNVPDSLLLSTSETQALKSLDESAFTAQKKVRQKLNTLRQVMEEQ